MVSCVESYRKGNAQPDKMVTASNSVSPSFLTTAPSAISRRYMWYVVLVLTLCYTFSFADRQILSLLVGPIKRDLVLSDTEIGLLQGLAFALFYAVLGLPLGRLADTTSRRNLIAIGVFLWSLMTVGCSAARNYGSLFLARIGVGVGEAALSPAAMPLISDYFPQESLGTALSVYSMGIAIGSGLALAVGGTVVDAVSRLKTIYLPILGTIAAWRMTFIVVGAPGLLLVLLVYTIREPLRQSLLRTADGQPSKLKLAEVFAQLAKRWKSMLGLTVGMVFQSMGSWAFFAWAPTFFIRVHGWSAGQVGRALGVITLTFCCAGMYVGGRLSDRWQRRGVSEGPLKVAVASAIGVGILLGSAMMLPSARWSLTLIAPALFFIGLPNGCMYAAIQLILPNQVRGQASALFFMILNLGGLVLGPLLPGLFDDHLFKTETMIGKSVGLTVMMSSVMMLIILRATYQPYRRDYMLMNCATTTSIAR